MKLHFNTILIFDKNYFFSIFLVKCSLYKPFYEKEKLTFSMDLIYYIMHMH